MKVEIKSGGHNLNLKIPNALVFNRISLGIAVSAGKKHAPEAMANLSTEAMKALVDELKRIRKKYGTWELVEVISTDGEIVKVIL